ncbi:hypothetical protein NQ318_011306 [Aromia moschata]|uniref:Uncharacterized protein n=1 Tax=Aromia moschata TaxID=1265417 RepID=A0AAV8XVX6_9CUCU|nr:hypothetical protein NQ318_011306 [Aromia moschata]
MVHPNLRITHRHCEKVTVWCGVINRKLLVQFSSKMPTMCCLGGSSNPLPELGPAPFNIPSGGDTEGLPEAEVAGEERSEPGMLKFISVPSRHQSCRIS